MRAVVCLWCLCSGGRVSFVAQETAPDEHALGQESCAVAALGVLGRRSDDPGGAALASRGVEGAGAWTWARESRARPS